MSELTDITDLLTRSAPTVAMLAPSFPVMYRYPAIIGKLKRLGCRAVVEVTTGAAETNVSLVAAIRKNPDARFITSPCPSVVRMVRKKYPELTDYLTETIDSPMSATARLVLKNYPGHTPVFIGPCHAKKMEAQQDRKDLGIIVLTYVELEVVFTTFNIKDEASDAQAVFDMTESRTRTYPIDGGLTDTSGVRAIFAEDEIRIVSGWKQCESALKEFISNTKIRLLDVLFCEGGCINGPGIASPLSFEARKKAITAFAGL